RPYARQLADGGVTAAALRAAVPRTPTNRRLKTAGYRLRVTRPGNVLAVRLSIVVVAAVALLSFSTPAVASPSIRYGLQDDAWLFYGPGTLKQRLDRLQTRSEERRVGEECSVGGAARVKRKHEGESRAAK